MKHKISYQLSLNAFPKAILELRIDGITIDVRRIAIKKYINNYFNKAINNVKKSYRLWIDGERFICKKNSKFIIRYRCLTCGKVQIISSYARFLSKINNKDTLVFCRGCRQKYDLKNKKLRHDALIKKPRGTVKFKRNIQKKEQVFSNMDMSFKTYYKNKYFSPEEWENAIKEYQVEMISGYKITEIDRYIFAYSVPNYLKFIPKVQVGEKIITINNIKRRCKICGKLYSIHFSKSEFNKCKTHGICRNCMEYYLINNTWRIRHIKNCKGNIIKYQSSIELQFINICNQNNIEIQNGPVVQYLFNNKFHNYNIDFYIPCINEIFEIKAMHQFQRDDIASGKFQAKCDAAQNEVFHNKFNSFTVLYDYEMTDEWKENFILKCKSGLLDSKYMI